MAVGKDQSVQKPSEGTLLRAAECVRMSTDHQRYSTENQAVAIRDYAARSGMQITCTYADEGKSGPRIDGRDALKRLIEDVTSGRADFEAILVYDVSRWGRFQDADDQNGEPKKSAAETAPAIRSVSSAGIGAEADTPRDTSTGLLAGWNRGNRTRGLLPARPYGK